MAPPAARVCAPTCDPGTLLGSSFARDVTLRPVAGNTVLSFGKCSLNWLDAKAVLTRFKRARHTWLLLVGDSDTRGMALALLQILAAAGAGDAAAERDAGLWLGRAGANDWQTPGASEQWSRRCVLDWVFGGGGEVLSTRSVSCSKLKMRWKTDYAVLGRDYNLSLPAALGTASLRVTFVGTSALNQTLGTLEGITAHLHDTGDRPTALYVGVGAHLAGEDSSTATALSRSLGDLSRRLAPPSTRVFGSVIGQRNRNAKFDAHSAPLLQRQGFVVLNRSTPLHARTSASGEQGIRASTGHAPHLINLVDWQRMLAAGVFDAIPIFKAAAACGGVSFAPWCVGRGKGDRHRFIEAFQHYCRHEKVDSR